MVAGSVLSAMAKHPVTSADVGYRGTQLKMTLVLDGQQQVIFKPRWYHKLCFNINFIFFLCKVSDKGRQLFLCVWNYTINRAWNILSSM